MNPELRKLFSMLAAATATAAVLTACGGGGTAPAASAPSASGAPAPEPAAPSPAPANPTPAPATPAPTTNASFGPIVDFAKITTFCPQPSGTNTERRLNCDRRNEGAAEVIAAINTFLTNLNATGVVYESNFPSVVVGTPCTIAGFSSTSGKVLGSVNGVELPDLSVETAYGNPQTSDTQQTLASYSFSGNEHRIAAANVSRFFPARNSSPIALLEFPESANSDFRAILYWNNDRDMSFRCRINR